MRVNLARNDCLCCPTVALPRFRRQSPRTRSNPAWILGRGVIMVPQWLAGVAGRRPNGKRRVVISRPRSLSRPFWPIRRFPCRRRPRADPPEAIIGPCVRNRVSVFIRSPNMDCLRIRTLSATCLVLALLMALGGCSGDRRGRSHRDSDRRPSQRYERHDDDRRGDRQDGRRHEDQQRHSGRDQRHRDAR